jgi:hypothetical protein
MAKNTIRRSLRSIVDPELTKTEIEDIWDHFHSAAGQGRIIKRV